VQEAIKVDEHMQGQLQFCHYPNPLPSWFVDARNAE